MLFSGCQIAVCISSLQVCIQADNHWAETDQLGKDVELPFVRKEM